MEFKKKTVTTELVVIELTKEEAHHLYGHLCTSSSTPEINELQIKFFIGLREMKD